MTAAAPTTLAAALEARAARPGAAVVAGGTDLLPALRTGRLAEPAEWLSLHAVAELSGVGWVDPPAPARITGGLSSHSDEKAPMIGGRLRIGAGTTVAIVETDPLFAPHATALCDAAALIGSPATRTVATVGGNLVNGSPAMELGAPLLALGATVELASLASGSAAATSPAVETVGSAVALRRLPLEAFLLGPGRVDLHPDELLVAVELDGAGAAATSPADLARAGLAAATSPADLARTGLAAATSSAHLARPGQVPAGSAYVRIDGRAAMEVALAGAAAAVELTGDGETVAAARIALCAVAPTCRRAPAAERLLAGRRPTAALLDAVAQEAAAAADPIDDHRAPAAYRRAVTAVAVRRALDTALARASAAPTLASAPPAPGTPAPGMPAGADHDGSETLR